MNQPVKFNTPFDEKDWIEMNPGWHHGGGGHHGGMQDSLFCQILETFPESMNTIGNENAFAGYEVDFYYADMMGGGMHHGMGCNGHFEFESDADFQFHYSDDQLSLNNINEQTVEVKFWDSDVNGWVVVSNAVINTSANTVSFSNNKVGNFYILTGDSPTGNEGEPTSIVNEFTLSQNYPNPFNPSTTIKFNLPVKSSIKLEVFNILGQMVSTLIDGSLEAGQHSVEFNPQNLSSGVYIYKLSTDQNFNFTRKMILLR